MIVSRACKKRGTEAGMPHTLFDTTQLCPATVQKKRIVGSWKEKNVRIKEWNIETRRWRLEEKSLRWCGGPHRNYRCHVRVAIGAGVSYEIPSFVTTTMSKSNKLPTASRCDARSRDAAVFLNCAQLCVGCCPSPDRDSVDSH